MRTHEQVRAEDAFDTTAVLPWLVQNLDDHRGLSGPMVVRQFHGGVSNLTYLLEFPERRLVLRRPPAGTKARGAHDLIREFELQRAVRPSFGLVPEMLACCRDETVIGSQFYVMEHVPGPILKRDVPEGLDVDVAFVGRLCAEFVKAWVSLHSVETAGTPLAQFGRGPGHVTRQVTGWSARFARAQTPDVGSFQGVTAWLEANKPPDAAHVLVHNDFRFDNLVLDEADPGRIRAVLDWELASVGDPWLDLGSSLAYWVQADDDPAFAAFRQQPTHLPGMLTRWQVVSAYAEAMGTPIEPEQWRFYEVFGLFRLAVIAQQIHFRHFHGQTTNPVFALLGDAVRYLEHRCVSLISIRE